MSEMDKWSIDKHINIGHILMTVSVVTGVLWWGAKIEQRLAISEVKIETATRSFEVLEARIITAIDRLDNKIDRLIEKDRT